jgi:hypothetical protein
MGTRTCERRSSLQLCRLLAALAGEHRWSFGGAFFLATQSVRSLSLDSVKVALSSETSSGFWRSGLVLGLRMGLFPGPPAQDIP